MVSISITVFLACVVAVLVRSYRLSATSALLSIALGFSLASTGLAPMIGQVIGQVVHVISTITV